jgi:hypothetical protein
MDKFLVKKNVEKCEDLSLDNDEEFAVATKNKIICTNHKSEKSESDGEMKIKENINNLSNNDDEEDDEELKIKENPTNNSNNINIDEDEDNSSDHDDELYEKYGIDKTEFISSFHKIYNTSEKLIEVAKLLNNYYDNLIDILIEKAKADPKTNQLSSRVILRLKNIMEANAGYKLNEDERDFLRAYACIYKITNRKNFKSYVGRVVLLEKHGEKKETSRYGGYVRFKRHINKAHNTNNIKISKECRLLYKAIRKHGDHNFDVKIIQYCLINDMNKLESYYIDLFNTYRLANGYNYFHGANKPKDKVHVEQYSQFKAEVNARRAQGGKMKKKSHNLGLPANITARKNKGVVIGYFVQIKFLDETDSHYKAFLSNKYSLETKLEMAKVQLNIFKIEHQIRVNKKNNENDKNKKNLKKLINEMKKLVEQTI